MEIDVVSLDDVDEAVGVLLALNLRQLEIIGQYAANLTQFFAVLL